MTRPEAHGSFREIFGVFLRLGLTSFGGPIAHLAYFREGFVARRDWIDEAGYARLVALCQFLPGPASSQVGFALGVMRAGGLSGGLAAWLGFTLPSAVVMTLAGLGAAMLDGPGAAGIVHGLKLVAVAVVAQAVWGMARALAVGAVRSGIAVAALALVTLAGGAAGQIGAIVLGAVAGLILLRSPPAGAEDGLPVPITRRAGAAALVLFAALFALLPLLAQGGWMAAALADAFYRAGALVFGGGHVVLPLLEAQTVTPGWVPADAFLAGYGLAQAVPGPLFTFAAYLGAEAAGPAGAALALVAIFLPGLLLVYGALPFWDGLRRSPRANAAMQGTNAAVVGVLGAALYDPLWTGAILRPVDFALAAAGFVALTAWKAPAWTVVLGLGLAGAVWAP